MKRYFALSILFVLLPLLAPVVKAQTGQLDVIDFMRAKFNYDGFTELNSFLGINIHVYDKTSHAWIHYTEQPTCPPELGTCASTSWKARNMSRQKPGENIIYYNKGAIPNVNRVPETFWFNADSIYDFGEGYAYDPKDARDPTIFGLFHNFYLPAQDNPKLDFPNRGYIWSKRYLIPGEDTAIPYNNVKIEDYRNMMVQCYMGNQCHWDGAAKGNVKLIYYPQWDSSQYTWNDKPDTGNLPTPLEVVVNVQSNTDAAGNATFMERYIYARTGANSFGIIRYELWQPKEQVCGSVNCCTTKTCIGTMALANYNTFDNLMHYDPGEDPNQYFAAAYYSDPKLEVYPGTPSNGALPRSRFQLPGNGLTTDGKTLKAGDWMQLTEILTDGDWMISAVIPNRHCPDGYQYIGSMATSFVDYKDKNQGYGWAEFCGINKNVLLATSCPVNYESRAWFDTPNPSTAAYDYQGQAIGGQRLNYCVQYNEFHFPKQTFIPSIPGDFNGDGKVDINDYNIIVRDFGHPYTIFDYNQLVSNFGK